MLLKTLSYAAIATGTAVLALGFMTYSASRIDPANAYFQETNIYHSGLVGTHTLALTFDDGPSAQTGALLDALAKYNIKATFFIVGSRVQYRREVMDRMMREGHVVANHSYTHARMGRLYASHPEMLITEIGNTNNEIAPYVRAGQGLYFRAPYGVWRRVHADFLNQDPTLKYYVGPVYWDIGGDISYDDNGNMRAAADWDCWSQDLTSEQCGEGYLKEIRRKNGGVVLMHDIRQRSLTMVSAMLPTLVADGFKFVTLDDVKDFDQYRTPLPQDVPIAMGDGRTPLSAPAR